VIAGIFQSPILSRMGLFSVVCCLTSVEFASGLRGRCGEACPGSEKVNSCGRDQVVVDKTDLRALWRVAIDFGFCPDLIGFLPETGSSVVIGAVPGERVLGFGSPFRAFIRSDTSRIGYVIWPPVRVERDTTVGGGVFSFCDFGAIDR